MKKTLCLFLLTFILACEKPNVPSATPDAPPPPPEPIAEEEKYSDISGNTWHWILDDRELTFTDVGYKYCKGSQCESVNVIRLQENGSTRFFARRFKGFDLATIEEFPISKSDWRVYEMFLQQAKAANDYSYREWTTKSVSRDLKEQLKEQLEEKVVHCRTTPGRDALVQMIPDVSKSILFTVRGLTWMDRETGIETVFHVDSSTTRFVGLSSVIARFDGTGGLTTSTHNLFSRRLPIAPRSLTGPPVGYGNAFQIFQDACMTAVYKFFLTIDLTDPAADATLSEKVKFNLEEALKSDVSTTYGFVDIEKKRESEKELAKTFPELLKRKDNP